MSDMERIQQYIERTKFPVGSKTRYLPTCAEIVAIQKAWQKDPFQTLFTVFYYGRAKGFRAAQRRAGK